MEQNTASTYLCRVIKLILIVFKYRILNGEIYNKSFTNVKRSQIKLLIIISTDVIHKTVTKKAKILNLYINQTFLPALQENMKKKNLTYYP